MYRIDNFKIFDNLNEETLIDKVLKKNNIFPSDLISYEIVKKSIDARDKKNIHYVYSFNLDLNNKEKYHYLKEVPSIEEITITKKRYSDYQPIIIGSGPSGLFCALTLIDNGYKPIIIEQGSCVEKRQQYLEEYRLTGRLNEMCNVQFGEGGAGTFSDGKLTTGISSPLIKKVLNYFHKFGAPKEILYLNKPHIGTDNLVIILKNIREYIESHGGKYYFDTKFINFQKENNLIKVICDKEEFITDALVLAIGHSARDTFKMLQKNQLEMVRKNFSVGVRIEHKQQMINESQYGKNPNITLPPAEYKLVYHGENRSCYSFCMCPGGEVIASASTKETIVTNGMSEYKRDKDNANSALLVNVLTSDFAGTDPLAGMYFQEELEHQAYILGGRNNFAPVQRVEDFLKNISSTRIGSIVPSYKPGYTLCNLNDILPSFVSDTLKEGILAFDKKIKGFADPDAILTGVETRSSSPVTIVRNEELTSNIEGIYPCGEGAGYAGGITSSCVDGIKVAIKIIESGYNN